jgi:nucleotide-binding universal stress UspA family protein
MHVLLAYDASAGADEAVALLLSMRWPAGSAVRVVAVIEPSAALVPSVPLTPAGLVTSPEIEAQIRAQLGSDVDGAVQRLKAANLAAEGVVLYGRPGTVIVDEARGFSADVVVAGSRGHGPIATLVLGSVSAELVDHAPCPVLVARRPTAARVLLASDGSASASHAGTIVAEWPMFEGVEIRVLSVAEVVRPWHTGLAPSMYRQVVEAYASDLAKAKTEQDAVARAAVDRLTTAGRTADAKLRVGDAAAEIIDEASSWGADLVVLGSRGLTGLSRLVLGSVARNVLQGTDSSVLIVHAPAKGLDEADMGVEA